MGVGWIRFEDKFLDKIDLEEFSKALVSRSQRRSHHAPAFFPWYFYIVCVNLPPLN